MNCRVQATAKTATNQTTVNFDYKTIIDTQGYI